MKKLTQPWALILLLLSCSSETHEIRDVAYKYAMHTSNYEVDSAYAYATQETQATTLAMATILMEKIGEEYIKSDTPAQIDIPALEKVNDTVAYAVYHKTTPIKNFTDTLWLRKRDGQWLVHCPLPVIKKRSEKPRIAPSDSTVIKRLVVPYKSIKKSFKNLCSNQ